MLYDIIESMEQKKNLTLKEMLAMINPNDNTVLSSKLQDDNGNISLFKMLIDPNEPFVRQRIGNYERVIY